MFPAPIVSATWLAGRLDDIAVIDVRWYLDGRSGRSEYTAGHIPSAVFADLDSDLSSPPSAAGGRHPLPSPEDFAATLRRLGIGESTPVVAYDDAGGAIAARLWWMLHVLGHPVAVLDGGIDAWSGELSTTPTMPLATTRAALPWPESRFRTADQVANTEFEILLDARSADRYTGENTTVDPRPGHIPGALSAPFAANLRDGALIDAAALSERYAELGVASDTRVVAYCGSGVTACHDLLALKVCGLGAETALFVGSSSAWAGDPDRPLELDGR